MVHHFIEINMFEKAWTNEIQIDGYMQTQGPLVAWPKFYFFSSLFSFEMFGNANAAVVRPLWIRNAATIMCKIYKSNACVIRKPLLPNAKWWSVGVGAFGAYWRRSMKKEISPVVGPFRFVSHHHRSGSIIIWFGFYPSHTRCCCRSLYWMFVARLASTLWEMVSLNFIFRQLLRISSTA